jgi:flagellar biosynthesis/type III secretory pathway M-ring protein FliF/YscJ
MFAAAAQRAEAERRAALEQASTAAGSAEETPAGEQPRSLEQRLEAVREIARQQPKLIAELIKEWMDAGV